MKNLSNLTPSTQDPIPAERLRELPLGGIYVRTRPSRIYDVIRITGWDASTYFFDLWAGTSWQRPFGALDIGDPPVCYPKLPPFLFAKTWRQVVAGEKDVTRRHHAPKWCKPGALFCGWDRSFRGGKGKARGLGVFEVVSVEQQARWICQECNAAIVPGWVCDGEGCSMRRHEVRPQEVDTLTPAELAREGFGDMTPDDFWKMLQKLGGVDDAGRTTRIEFKRL